ncbi:MAG: hypothetical protein V9H69_23340 [Anaerolineae bacterium]
MSICEAMIRSGRWLRQFLLDHLRHLGRPGVAHRARRGAEKAQPGAAAGRRELTPGGSPHRLAIGAQAIDAGSIHLAGSGADALEIILS